MRSGEASPELAHLGEALEETDIEFLLDEIPRAIEQSLDGLTSVAGIVRAMKEFSHPGRTEKVQVDLNRTIENSVTVARNEWKFVAELELLPDPALPPVPCFQAEFNQAILNIVVNAAHAIAEHRGPDGTEKGHITVATSCSEEWVEVRITDDGCGMPPDVRARIFDPFYTTKEVGKGTGQGLAIARSVIVDKHHGTLEVESVEGQGTTFVLRLPLDDEAATAIEDEAAAG